MDTAAEDARQRIGKIYAMEIIGAAVSAYGHAEAQETLATEFAERPLMLAALLAIRTFRWEPALLDGLNPRESVIASRAWGLIEDADSVTALIPAPFSVWLADGPLPDGATMTRAYESLPEHAQRVVMAGLAYLETRREHTNTVLRSGSG
ncbi:hypothetical protein AB0M39_01665 [Streptomyces sp. NPDC051907]|uniref:hypothetical protein n=1 Tax=Streptomyces sp. NPDC051907 TaxID=3155284 RepID=UPI0034393728